MRPIVRHHHERIDGRGYPDGLAGDRVPLLAQIVSIADVFDALTTDRPYRKVYVHPTHHAGYYPGAEAMTLKLLFDPQSGKVLGAQAVGGAGVDKRIDVLAVAIQLSVGVVSTPDDLYSIELAGSGVEESP